MPKKSFYDTRLLIKKIHGERWIVGVFQALKSETRIFGILDTFYNGNFGTLKPNEILMLADQIVSPPMFVYDTLGLNLR